MPLSFDSGWNSTNTFCNFVRFLLISILNYTHDDIDSINIIWNISDFDILNVLPTDTFLFGGQRGNTITQLILQKKKRTTIN